MFTSTHVCECILCCNTLPVHDKSLYISIKVYFLPSACARLTPCYVSHGTYIPVLSAKMWHPQYVDIRISLVLHWLLANIDYSFFLILFGFCSIFQIITSQVMISMHTFDECHYVFLFLAFIILFCKWKQENGMYMHASGFYTKGRPLVKSNLICPSDKLSWQPGCPILNINILGNFCISQGNGSLDNLPENLV